MAYCINCGKELPDGAKFYAECGMQINADSHEAGNRRKTIYHGEIYKCPACGEVLESFVSVCPTCGHELRGASATDSVREFVAKIADAQNEIQRISIIRNYPVPNTREDILEFMIMASTNIPGEQAQEVFEAWIVKFDQCYQKAQMVLKDPSDTELIQTIYDKTHRQINKKKRTQNSRLAKNTLSKSGSLLGKILLLIVKNAAIIAGIALFIAGIKAEYSFLHEVGGVLLLIISASILTSRRASYFEIFLSIGSGILTYRLAALLDNSFLLELGGPVVVIISVVAFFVKLSRRKKGAGEQTVSENVNSDNI